MNLKEITKKAEEKQDIVAKDPHRLALHLMPPVGWMNDPNGLCQFRGEYHVFYQYSPLDANGSMKAWGHYVSKDLLHWTQLEAPLFPDRTFDRDGVYSGSAWIENDKMYLYYTGNVKQDGTHDFTYTGREANTILVTSEDGRQFSEKTLLMTNDDYPQSYTCHIRDPKVWKTGGHYYMIQGGRKKMYPEAIGTPNSEETDYGTALIFESEDLKKWKFLEDISTEERFGYMWECPDYFVVDKTPVLSLSPQGLEHEAYRRQNVYQSGYFLLEQEILSEDPKLDPEKFIEWDMGFDFYAPQTFCDEKERRILIGWAGIGDAAYDNQPTVEAGWQHALTLPREITCKNGRLYQNPVEELKKLRGEKIVVKERIKTTSPVFELELNQLKGSCEVRIGAGTEAFYLKYENNEVELQITPGAGCGRNSRKARLTRLEKIRMIVDTSLAEIYLNDGEMVFTSRFYFDGASRQIEVKGTDSADLWYLDGLSMNFPM